MMIKEHETFYANIEMITSTLTHQSSEFHSFGYTSQDISGEYMFIGYERKNGERRMHVFSNERGHDLLLDLETWDKIQEGEKVLVGRNQRFI